MADRPTRMNGVSRIYTEDCGYGVIEEIVFSDAEIRYVVKDNGQIIFNKAIAGKYSLKQALVMAAEQRRASVAAAEEKRRKRGSDD